MNTADYKILPKTAYNRESGKRGDLAAVIYRMNVEAKSPAFFPTEEELRADCTQFSADTEFNFEAELERCRKGQSYRIVDSLLAETERYERALTDSKRPAAELPEDRLKESVRRF